MTKEGGSTNPERKKILYTTRCLPYQVRHEPPKLGTQTKQTKIRNMKKIAFSALSAIALSTAAFAGAPMVDSKDKVIMPEPCIKDMEFQIDAFGSYTDTRGGGNGDGFGGGLALNYFFTRFVGVGIESNVTGGGDTRWDLGGRLLVRYPIDDLCLVPYAFVAGGVVTGNGDTEGAIGVGGGLEYRVVAQKLGIFAEGRYTWTGGDNGGRHNSNNSDDAAQVRVGVRVVF